MPILTFVARVMDGMLLVASMEHTGDGNLDIYKQQAKQVLKKLNPRSPAKCSIESGPCNFHYLIQDDICFLTLADRSYPKRLAFLYLEDIRNGFIDELRRDFGDSWLEKVATVSRPYAFIKFDKFIQKKRKEYSDPQARHNMGRLNDDLSDIHNVMKQNIQEVLNRGEKLEHVSTISAKLASDSKQFKWGAKKLNLQALYRKYAPVGVAGFIILIFIYFRFF